MQMYLTIRYWIPTRVNETGSCFNISSANTHSGQHSGYYFVPRVSEFGLLDFFS